MDRGVVGVRGDAVTAWKSRRDIEHDIVSSRRARQDAERDDRVARAIARLDVKREHRDTTPFALGALLTLAIVLAYLLR